MKIAIVSDTHGNPPNFRKILNWLKTQNVITILHCGDIGGPEFLKESLADFGGEFKGVLGNMDADYRIDLEKYQDLPKIDVRETVFEGNFGGKNIAVAHFPEVAKELIASGKFDWVFYGHTHKPWKEETHGKFMANPGNVAGIFFQASFAVFDTEKNSLELKILDRLKY